MKEITAGNMDHAKVDAHDQHLYLDWYKEWEVGYYRNKKISSCSHLNDSIREGVMQIINTVNHVDMFSPEILHEIFCLP